MRRSSKLLIAAGLLLIHASAALLLTSQMGACQALADNAQIVETLHELLPPAIPGVMESRSDLSMPVLEINGEHAVFAALAKISDEEKLKAYADLLYSQALLIAGLPLEDPTAVASAVCDIMASAI